MYTKLSISNPEFNSHIAGTELVRTHGGTLTFSTDKPTVIVGPNGSGKSAVINALAYHAMAMFSGISTLDARYSESVANQELWPKRTYGRDIQYMPGYDFESDGAAALYYRPDFVPGDEETCLTTAMLCGYFEEAKAIANAVRHKSSGQAAQVQMQRILDALAGTGSIEWQHKNVNMKLTREDVSKMRYASDSDYRELHMAERFAARSPNGIPCVLMDEPECSLDAGAHIRLWKAIEAADPRKVQVIVATHSPYPLMHRERFHIIEAVPGYMESVDDLW